MLASYRQARKTLPPLAALRVLVLFVIAGLSSACSSRLADSTMQPVQPAGIDWHYTDLRLLDPVDAAIPEHDLLAVYLRHAQAGEPPRTQVRLDFLDLPVPNQPQVYIALDFTSGGTRGLPLSATASLDWDVLLHIPANGPIQAINSQQQPVSSLALRVMRDSWMDSLEVSFDASALYPLAGNAAPPEIGLQVFVSPPESSLLADESLPTSSFSSPPEPARYLLAFWNAYPAYTPAQGLRRWDGAHSGPLGGRHGLYNLLRTASARRHPLLVLDLKTPTWLSALDYAGDSQLVEDFAESGLLLLPETTPPGAAPDLAAYWQALVGRFNLPANLFGYTQSAGILSNPSRFLFYPARQTSPISTILTWGNRRLFPIPFEPAIQPPLQPDLDGLSLQARRWMLTTALSASLQSAPPVLVLGGDFTQATWGNPQIARAAFDYLRGHPWMQPVDGNDLRSLPTTNAASPPPVFETISLPAIVLPVSEIPPDACPGNPACPLLESALQSYLGLVPPSLPADPAYQALLAIYQPQVQVLLDAAAWAQDPRPQSTCDLDSDQDGRTECVLASTHLYAVLDPAHASLRYLFALEGGAAHQVVAPSSQLSFGRSDPAQWDMSRGLAADPQVLPGAFYDATGQPFVVEVSAGQVRFRHPEGSWVKTFSLNEDRLRLEYQSATPLRASLPLVLDPWLRFYPGWGDAFQGESTPDGFIWRTLPGAQIEIRTSGRLTPYTFLDTRASMNQVENPNQEFPPGHYLPFPLALLEFSSPGDMWVEIAIR